MDVEELGQAVSGHGLVGFPGLQGAEIEARPAMEPGAHVDDPAGAEALRTSRSRLVEQKIRKVVDRELHLQPVPGQGPAGGNGRRVVDQDVQPVVAPLESFRQSADLPRRGQIAGQRLDGFAPFRSDGLPDDFALGGVPADGDRRRARAGQGEGRFEPDPPARSGDQDGFAFMS